MQNNGFIDSVAARPVPYALAALAVAVLASQTFFVVPETKQGLVLSYGQIQRVFNAYRAGERFGATGAGLGVKIPFVEQVTLIDKRVLGVELERQEVLSTDQLRLQVDAFARYRITNPQVMYEKIRSEDALREQLRSILGTSLRDELGKRTFATLLSPERGAIMANIMQGLEREARKYGATVVDVRINRADLPDGPPLDSAYERMRSARQQEAAAILAEGQKQAQLIRADAHAKAAKTYADSFGKDANFYAFYRAMQSYQTTFNSQGSGKTTVVLTPGSGYLKEFGGVGGN